ncbi:MAG: hypothetical protein IJL26_13940 [Clostridia bacterium]|nr:hypothetical protein [Clostridia bacterium]
MTKKEYIEKAVSGIRNKTERREAEEELRAHLDELTELWTARGFEPSDAEQKAVGEMGAPEKTAEELGRLHSGRFLFAAEILTAILYLLASVVALVFARFSFLLVSLFYEEPLSCLAAEAVLFCVCAFPLLFGVKRKNPLLCFSAAVFSCVICLSCCNEMLGEVFSPAYSAHTLVSPGLFAVAVALLGRWDVFNVFPVESVCARSSVLFALTVLLYMLIPVSSVVLTVLYARRRTRCSRKARRAGKTVRRLLFCVCSALLVVDTAFSIYTVPGKFGKLDRYDKMRYNSWLIVQSDAIFPASAIERMSESELCTDEVRFEIEYVFDFFGYYTNYCLVYGEESTSARIRDSVPGLFDMYEYSIRQEIVREKRYLLAIPVCGVSASKNYDKAAWYDLKDGGIIRLKFSNDPNEFSYLDLIVADR